MTFSDLSLYLGPARAAEKGAGDGLVPGRGQHRPGVHQHPGLRADPPAHRVRGDLQGRRGQRSTQVQTTFNTYKYVILISFKAMLLSNSNIYLYCSKFI